MGRRIKENPSLAPDPYMEGIAKRWPSDRLPEEEKPLESFPVTGRCAVCKNTQYQTPSGTACKNGHGGEGTLPLMRTRAEALAEKQAVKLIEVEADIDTALLKGDFKKADELAPYATFGFHRPPVGGGMVGIDPFASVCEKWNLNAFIHYRPGAAVALLSFHWDKRVKADLTSAVVHRPPIFVRTITEGAAVIDGFETLTMEHNENLDAAKRYLVEHSVNSEAARVMRAINHEGAKDPPAPEPVRRRR